MITWSIGKLVGLCVSIGLSSFSLGLSVSNLIWLYLDKDPKDKSQKWEDFR